MSFRRSLSRPTNFTFLKAMATVFFLAVVCFVGWQWFSAQQQLRSDLATSETQRREAASMLQETQATLSQVQKELDDLKNSDPHKTNRELQAKIDMIEKTYRDSLATYEKINDFENSQYPDKQVEELRTLFATILRRLSEQNYEAALAALVDIDKKADTYEAQRAAEILAATQREAERQAQQQTAGQAVTAPTATVANDPPSNGYRRQVVNSDAGAFTVSIVAGDMASTRVIVDTASPSDCANDCPVLSLADYVSRNGAYAGINGTYFCPASYPSCAGKTNSFDLLVMNKDKTYFNSANNVYSTNPGVIFQSGSMRFVSQISQWGRDTSVDGVLSNYPLLVSGGNVVFGGDDDPKKGSKGNRSFVANRGGTAYIGVVHSATVAEAARVLKAMGMDNGLNLDDGGSTALWFGGYKVGPGRALPNVILFKLR